MKKVVIVMLMAVAITAGFSQPAPSTSTDQASEIIINGPGGGIGGNRYVRS
ncbi:MULTISPECIES: hypothetical protein [Peribacillus]|uniref:hypothetical protein n=1 Tax=Peribacillus TaxID=2675229 RepID=UPI001F4EC719|nr:MULTISPECIES: hypothetical protein [unclassified Peribacillus]MCK1985185.1 hypothetical protein [Peribacillus sp. Aquil_B1]MCK2007165.1 hypothetical protein [Peribacillus sp. Aquil_B8]